MNLHLQQLVHQLVWGMEFWVLLALAQHWCVGGIGSGVSTISDASNNVLAGTDVMIRAGRLYTLNGSKRHESVHRVLSSTASALSGRGAAEALLSPRGARKIGAVRRAARSLHWHPMKRSSAPRRARVADGPS